MKIHNKHKRPRMIAVRRSPETQRALIEAIEPRILMSTTWSFSKLADFSSANRTPTSGLVMDSGGNLFGYTTHGTLTNVKGGIFEVVGSNKVFVQLASFSTSTVYNPVGTLVIDSSGNLYGNTSVGGSYGYGGVFEYNATDQTISMLASFDSTYTGYTVGAGLVMGSNGNLFGSTEHGGASGLGSVFEYDAFNNSLNVVAPLTIDNRNITANMIFDGSGNLYGAAQFGSFAPNIFEVDANNGVLNTLDFFDSSTTGSSSGSILTTDFSGNLYGTASFGAGSAGTVFEYVQGSGLTALASFSSGSPTGTSPQGGVVMDANGNLFGATASGSVSNVGAIYELTNANLSMLYPLDSTTGYSVKGGLVMDSAGDLFGVTNVGGANNLGTAFELIPSATNAVITSQPTFITAGTSQSISVSLENTNGTVDPANGSTVTLSIASGPNGATVGGTLSVSAVNGVATFSGLTFNQSGAYTLTASSSGLSPATTATITVSAAAASQLAFVQQPTGVIANQAMGTIEVDVEDAFGNLITTDNSSSVVLTTVDGSAITGTTTAQATGGVATFTGLSVAQLGAHTLLAMGGGFTTTSNSFTVGPDVWTGTIDSSWSNPANWQGNVVPSSGESIDFPANSGTAQINLSSDVIVGNLTFDGPYTLNNQTITVDGNIISNSPGGSIASAVDFAQAATITVGTSDDLTLDSISGSGNLTKTGAGTLVLSNGGSYSSYTGTTEVVAGTLDVEAVLIGGVTLDAGTTLDGAGTVGGIIDHGGAIALTSGGSPSQLTSSAGVSLDSSSTLLAGIASLSNGQLIATGSSIDLTGATLSVSLVNGYIPSLGTVITVISNQTGNAITGNFGGLVEGAMTNIGGVNFQISYVGGSGNDVTLTVVPDQWTGAANTSDWNTAANWASGVVPASGDSIEFPAHSGGAVTVNLLSGVSIGSITFDGVYQLGGSTITVTGGITNNAGPAVIGNDLVLTHSTTVTVGNGDLLVLSGATADGGHHYGLTKQGAGELSISGGPDSSYTGITEVAQGDLEVGITLPGDVTVDAGAQLGGIGSFGAITVSGGILRLAGQIYVAGPTSSGNVSLANGSTLVEQISYSNSDPVGEIDGTLSATGAFATIDLSGTTLQVTTLNGYAPTLGDVITLISNQTGNAITGTFSGLPEGALATFDGVTYQISYIGGSGHDVTLTVLPDQWTGAANNGAWNTAGNWLGGVVPASGDSVVFPSHGGGLTDITLGHDQTVGNITFNGNYHLTDHNLMVNGSITAHTGLAMIQSSMVLSHATTTMNLNTGDHLILYAISDGGHHFGITEQGGGTLTLAQTSTYTGATVVTAGTLQVNLSLQSIITVDSGATLNAATSFAAAAGIVDNGGTVELGQDGSPGQFSVSGSISLSGGSTFQEDIFDDSLFGEQDGVLVATGLSTSIDLTGSTLALSLQGDATPSAGTVITLISNQTGNAITGTFAGLPEGAMTIINGVDYQVSYIGGFGGDVTLTVVTVPVASQLVFHQQPTGATAGQSIGTVVVDVEDQYGNVVTGDSSSTITLAGAGLTGTLTATVTNGEATFTGLSMTTAGAHTLLATDSALTSATSSSITIVAAAADKLMFTQQPLSAIAGAGIGTIVVNVEDHFGNLVTTDSSSTVTLAGTSLSGFDIATASNGVATFSGLSMWQAGTRSLTATDAQLTSATSNSITITPAAANQVAFTTQPHGAVAGVTIGTVVACLEDQFGNVITSDSASTILLTGSSLTGMLTRTLSSGVATFSGLAMTQSGTRTLTAADSGVTSATSNPIAITPAAASEVVFTTQPTGAVAGASIGSVVVSVEDQYGNVVTSDSSSTITLAGASLTGILTTTASSGIATFSGLSMTQAGSRALSANDSGLTSATSNLITITPDLASQVVFTTQPHGAVAGATIGTVVASVEDQYGNVVTSDSTSAVTIVGTSLTGVLTVTASGGVATFNGLSMSQSGTRALTATDNGLTSATSNLVTITAAAASQLVFTTQPTSAVAGAGIGTIAVAVEDQFGNLVTTDVSTVTIVGTSLNGTASVQASSGVATFADLSMTRAGTRSLSAGDLSLTSATSNPITISSAAASQLVFTTQPIGAVAGASIGTIAVSVEDQFGNVVTTDASTVTIAGTSLTGTATAQANSGIATFNGLSMTQAGTRTLLASELNVTSATSNSIIISTGAASQVVFTTQPHNATAGASLGTVVVKVEDQYGNVVATDSASSVVLAGNTVGGTLTATVANGVATFTGLSMTQSGAYSLTATDAALAGGTSNSITIAAATASQLVFTTSPHSATAGASIGTMAVSVEDQFGNVVTSDSASTVTLSGASLNGNLSVIASNGVATFGLISAPEAGSYILSAQDGSLTAATSSSIIITPASAAQLVFAQAKLVVSAGHTMPSVAVEIEDVYGNVVTTDSSTVTLSGADLLGGPSSVTAVGGIAIFQNLTATGTGTFTLTAMRSGLAAGTSSPISFTTNAAWISSVTDFQGNYGETPQSTLISDANGNLYGTTQGDERFGYGTIFRVSGGAIQTLAFLNASTGGGPLAGLVMDSSGNLFGTTTSGGQYGNGTVFKLTAGSTTPSVVASFNGTYASGSESPLLIDFAGNLFGETATGGTHGDGTVFEIPYNTNAINTLANLDGTDTGPQGGLVIDSAGNLYGTTNDGSNHTVFKVAARNVGQSAGGQEVSTPNRVLTVLRSFTNVGALGRLTIDSVGNLFGTTNTGGTHSVGTVFKISAGNASITTIANFDGTNGANPQAGVILDSSGDLFGTTSYGPTLQGGVFEITAGSGVITPLVNFSGDDANTINTNVTMDATGNLWGVGTTGGSNFGTVYEIQRQGHVAITSAPTTITAGAAQTFTVNLENANGVVDTANESTVTLSIASGPGGATMGGTLNVTAINGVASFSGITFTHSGIYTLTANSNGLAPFTSANIPVNAAGANHLVFAQQPGSAMAGSSLGTVVVDIEDQFGNIAIADASTVTLTGTSLTGTLAITATNGVATFSGLAIDPVGSYTLTASDDVLAPATSNAITISPAAAAQLVFAQQPTSGTEDQNLGTIEVDIEDAFGNLVAGDSSTVTLTANDGTPLGGVTSEAASGGIAIFSNVSIAGFGALQLSASDGSLPVATSGPIAVAPSLASLTITAPASTVDQGTSLQLQLSGANPSGVSVDLTNVIWSLDAGSSGSIDQQGLFTAGNSIGTATARATCEGQTATFAITINGSPVISVSPYVHQITPASNTATLHVQGQQAGTNTNLIYTWSIISQPAVVSGGLSVGSSPLAVFSVNGTNSAANTSVTFLASGTYTFQVTASDGIQSVSSNVQVTATVKPSATKTQMFTTQVAGASTIGNAQQISGFVITFNGPLDAATAQDIRGYRIGRLAGGNKIVPESAVYDPATYSVTITLAKAMPIQRGTGMVQVLGSGRYAVRDAQGHLINGDSNGNAGGSFTWRFSMRLAKTVSYRTAAGDLVKLTLKGPGKIISELPAGSSAPIITLTGTNPVSSVLTGKLRKGRKSAGYVVLDQLNGTSGAKIQLGENFHVNEYNADDVHG